ncbi:hypothetical protein PSA83_06430 (plasmid) [Pseudomonas aeruginosa]|nr:hypothetical protein PSA83_06430 [Pseudomonas aeruginosa]
MTGQLDALEANHFSGLRVGQRIRRYNPVQVAIWVRLKQAKVQQHVPQRIRTSRRTFHLVLVEVADHVVDSTLPNQEYTLGCGPDTGTLPVCRPCPAFNQVACRLGELVRHIDGERTHSSKARRVAVVVSKVHLHRRGVRLDDDAGQSGLGVGAGDGVNHGVIEILAALNEPVASLYRDQTLDQRCGQCFVLFASPLIPGDVKSNDSSFSSPLSDGIGARPDVRLGVVVNNEVSQGLAGIVEQRSEDRRRIPAFSP